MTAKTLKALAELLQADFTGNPDQMIHRVVHPAQATSPEDLALILDPKMLPLIAEKNIQTILAPEQMPIPDGLNALRVKRPKVALAQILEQYAKPVHVPPGIHPSAVVDPSAHLGEGVSVGAAVFRRAG